MSAYTIHISEAVYRRLSERAARLQLTPEQLIERLLMLDFFAVIEDDTEFAEPIPATDSEEAFAAFQRLTTCFADVTIPDLEATLADLLVPSPHNSQQSVSAA